MNVRASSLVSRHLEWISECQDSYRDISDEYQSVETSQMNVRTSRNWRILCRYCHIEVFKMNVRVIRSCCIANNDTQQSRIRLSSHKIILHKLTKRSLEHNYIDHFLNLMLLKEFIYWSDHFSLSVSFNRLLFYCLVSCNVRLQLHQNVHFCLALAACIFIFLSHRLVFMNSQVQSYQNVNESRSSLNFLQCIANNVSDNLSSYTKLTSSPPNYEAFERETEAKTILRDQDFQSITQILRFRLYEHKDSLRQVLQHRWNCQLSEILIDLHPTRFKDDHQAVAKLSKAQKIEVILRLVESTQSFSPRYWSWKSYKAANETNAGKIVADIDEESCSLFRKISFRNWLRHAVEYQKQSVDQLVFQHENLSRRLSWYLCRHFEENHKYFEVKKVN